ncbi:MAG: hypothetical protein OXC31_02625 [Spirochaetaceae bacterium]|nr:hypothetical protein [Spirochaetaceae bacterium]
MSKFDGVLGRGATPAALGPITRPTRQGKSSDPEYHKTTVYLPKQLHRDVKIACLQADPPLDMSDVIEQRLADWLTSRHVAP